MNKYIDEYLTYLASVRKLSPKTLQSYHRDFDLFLRYYNKNPLYITDDELRMVISRIALENYEPSSINRFLSTIRGFYKYLVKFKILQSNPTTAIRNLKTKQKLPRFLEHDQAIDFCSSPETLDSLEDNTIVHGKKINDIKIKPLWATRDKALFLSLYSTGCRVSEISYLKLIDFESDMKTAIIKGKGSKERYVFFSEDAKKALMEYFVERKALLLKYQNNSKASKYVFLSKRGNRLSVRGIQHILHHYSQNKDAIAGISPHSLRHSFATTMVSKGVDIRIIQEMLGHENISTTQRYTHITPERLKKLYHQSHPHG